MNIALYYYLFISNTSKVLEAVSHEGWARTVGVELFDDVLEVNRARMKYRCIGKRIRSSPSTFERRQTDGMEEGIRPYHGENGLSLFRNYSKSI